MPVSTEDPTRRLREALERLTAWLQEREADPDGSAQGAGLDLAGVVELVESAARALVDGGPVEPPERGPSPLERERPDRARDLAASEGLRGQSRTITIPELLNFVAGSYKRGLLRIRSDAESFLIQVEHGRVQDARCDRLRPGEGVVEILLEQGRVAREDVERLHTGGGRPPDTLVAALLEGGLVSEADVRSAVERQVRRIFLRLCDALEAEFWFYEDVRMTTRPRVGLDVTSLLLDSARQVDEQAHLASQAKAGAGSGPARREPDAAPPAAQDGPLEERFLAVLRRLADEQQIDLPLFDVSTCELLALLWDEGLDIEALSERIELDVGLCTHLLRVANSARNAPAVPITAIQSAVTRLGLDGVRDLVLGITVRNKVFDVPDWNDAVRAVWHRSAVRSGFARAVERAGRVATTRGSMSALLLEVGKPVILAALPRIEAELGQRVERERVLELVEEVHPEVGALLIGRWGLPAWLEHVVRHQRAPETAPSHQLDAWLAHLADRLARWAEEQDEAAVNGLLHLRACLELCLFPNDVRAILDGTDTILEQAAAYE